MPNRRIIMMKCCIAALFLIVYKFKPLVPVPREASVCRNQRHPVCNRMRYYHMVRRVVMTLGLVNLQIGVCLIMLLVQIVNPEALLILYRTNQVKGRLPPLADMGLVVP